MNKDEIKMKNAVALKKFSIISPALNKQVTNKIQYFKEVASKPIEMPYIGMRQYSPRTLETWLYDYGKSGLDGLVKPSRSDKGKARKISAELGELIIARRKQNPRLTIAMLYEQMVSEGLIDPLKVSKPTFYRYMEDLLLTGEMPSENTKETLRFSHENVGELWQGDILYGSHIAVGKKKVQTYLHLFLDDCSRYPVYGQFYLSQNFETLRHCFKEAVARRGIPRLVYTDNGKIYRSQQFEYICASLGCTLLHSQPFVPQGRGKIERMFGTVRERFLSAIDPCEIKDIDDLNQRFFRWLDSDYTKKAHSSLNGLSPHDVLMSQVSKLNLITDRGRLEEAFMLRITRKIQHDATCQIENVLYETDSRFCGQRVEIRYEPEWINDVANPLPIYEGSKKIGEARVVRFHDNSHASRRFKGNATADNRQKYVAAGYPGVQPPESAVTDEPGCARSLISYADIDFSASAKPSCGESGPAIEADALTGGGR